MPAKLNSEKFIEKSKLKHSDDYDYSMVEYVNSKTKVKIICKHHGIFEQVPNYHLSGRGCAICSGNIKSTNIEFVEKSKMIHVNKYDYSLVQYISNKIDVIIVCHIHGEFSQTPSNPLKGRGCRFCVGNVKKSTDIFIGESNKVHNNRYDYSLTNYVSARKSVKVICIDHGVFEVSPNNHISKKSGCPVCCESKGERLISDILDQYKIEYIKQYRMFHEKYAKSVPLRADFYLPKYNKIIEYNGSQHYISNVFFGGEEEFKLTLDRDSRKIHLCKDRNIDMLVIPYNTKINKIELIISNFLFLKTDC